MEANKKMTFNQKPITQQKKTESQNTVFPRI